MSTEINKKRKVAEKTRENNEYGKEQISKRCKKRSDPYLRRDVISQDSRESFITSLQHYGFYVPARYIASRAAASALKYVRSQHEDFRTLLSKNQWVGISPQSVDWTMDRGAPLFFIPAPWSAARCINRQTTLLMDTKTLCSALHTFPFLLTQKEASGLLQTRHVVAYGSPNRYVIFQLEELLHGWNAFKEFVNPRDIRQRFAAVALEDLLALLKKEYSKEYERRFQEISTSIRQSKAKQPSLGGYRDAIQSFDQEQQFILRNYFHWLFTAALLTRGWDPDKALDYPILKRSCAKVHHSEIRSGRLGYALGKVLEIQKEFSIAMKQFIVSLRMIRVWTEPEVDIIRLTSDDQNSVKEVKVSPEGVSKDPAKIGVEGPLSSAPKATEMYGDYKLRQIDSEDSESEDSEDDGSEEDNDGLLTGHTRVYLAEPSVGSSGRTYRTPLQAVEKKEAKIRIQRVYENKLASSNTHMIYNFNPVLLESLETKSGAKNSVNSGLAISFESKRSLFHAMNQILNGKSCIRSSSAEMLQTVGFYLCELFQLKAKKLPLECLEEIV